MTQLTCDYCKAVGVADTDSIDVAIAAAVAIGWRVKELGQVIDGKREFQYHKCPECVRKGCIYHRFDQVCGCDDCLERFGPVKAELIGQPAHPIGRDHGKVRQG